MTSLTAKLRPEGAERYTILIIDDNRDFVEFVKYLLAHHGFTMLGAYSGREGLAIVQQQKVDLVILDVMMPQMDGLTVCRELRQLAPTLPVFFLTAKDDLATRAAAIKLGVSEFLAKPVNIDDFVTRVCTQSQVSQWDKPLRRSPSMRRAALKADLS
jgi:DNA-binding response OmpR family regulator